MTPKEALKNREQLKKAYPSEKWTIKVNLMKDSQVIAILLNLRNQGKAI